MNINGVNNKNIIDAQSASKVAQDLFNALSKKSVDYSKVDLSKFNRQSLGVDFYNQRTDINFQRQIAMTNSGAFDGQLNLNAVQFLNTIAALGAYSDLSQTIGGKMTIDVPVKDIEYISKTENIANTINVFETDKDKKDSNPFYFGDTNSKDAKNKEA